MNDDLQTVKQLLHASANNQFTTPADPKPQCYDAYDVSSDVCAKCQHPLTTDGTCTHCGTEHDLTNDGPQPIPCFDLARCRSVIHGRCAGGRTSDAAADSTSAEPPAGPQPWLHRGALLADISPRAFFAYKAGVVDELDAVGQEVVGKSLFDPHITQTPAGFFVWDNLTAAMCISEATCKSCWSQP